MLLEVKNQNRENPLLNLYFVYAGIGMHFKKYN